MGPTIPSTSSWFSRWKSFTRAIVLDQKMPSIVSGADCDDNELSVACKMQTSCPSIPKQSVLYIRHLRRSTADKRRFLPQTPSLQLWLIEAGIRFTLKDR